MEGSQDNNSAKVTNTYLEVLIQLIHERNARRKVTAHDLLVTHAVQVLDNATQGVAMSSYQDLLACLGRNTRV